MEVEDGAGVVWRGRGRKGVCGEGLIVVLIREQIHVSIH